MRSQKGMKGRLTGEDRFLCCLSVEYRSSSVSCASPEFIRSGSRMMSWRLGRLSILRTHKASVGSNRVPTENSIG